MRVDYSLARALNRFALHHHSLERPLADYVRVSEALFLLGVVLLLVLGPTAG